MSEQLSAEARALQAMLQKLEAGCSPESLKEEFAEVFAGKPNSAISDAEQELMKAGVDSCTLGGLCDVHHAALASSENSMSMMDIEFFPPHPLAYFKLDGQKMMEYFRERVRPVVHGAEPVEYLEERLRGFLQAVDTHFNLKENVLFAYLDKHGVSGPTRVMWSVDDEIRSNIKAAIKHSAEFAGDVRGVVQYMHPTMGKLNELLRKEEEILIPLLAETLEEHEMAEAALAMLELGYNFEGARLWEIDGKQKPVAPSHPAQSMAAPVVPSVQLVSELMFPTGRINTQELMAILNTMGVEITFVGADDTLHYYSQPETMHFIRTKSNLGANVYTCHPHKSHALVEEVLRKLKSGESKVESRIATKNGKEFLVHYRALHDEMGNYLGCLETVTNLSEQDALVKSLRAQAPHH